MRTKNYCTKIILFILLLQPLFAFGIDKNWTEIFGKWQTAQQIVQPATNTENSFPEFGITYNALNSESIWTNASVDFVIQATEQNFQFGLLLNVVNETDFQLLRIQKTTNGDIIQLLRWQYGRFRKWQEIKLPTELKTNMKYSLCIAQSPLVDKEDWKMWKLIISEVESQKTILKKGIDNEQPVFGMGKVGLYASKTGITFNNFNINYKQPISQKLKLASLFTDGMVFQQNKTGCIWGKANPNEPITVSFLGSKLKTQADKNGNWLIHFPASKAQTGLSLTVTTKNEHLTINNVAIGEVWVASGQSNMAMKVWQTDVSKLVPKLKNNTNIRFFQQPQWPSTNPCFDSGGKWINADSVSACGLSAVALSFAVALQEKLNVAVGIIASHWGGTSIESWIPRQELATDSFTIPILNRYNIAIEALQKGNPTDYLFRHSWDIPGQYHAPGELFNGMIAPHTLFAINGIIWYQGESNANRAKQYEHLFPLLISSWRKEWNDKSLNFYFVQLAAYDGKRSDSEINDAWPHLREAQRLTLNKFSNIGMVVTTDLGNQTNIHPSTKTEVGYRLSRLALYDMYGFKSMIRAAPVLKNAEFTDKNEVIITFNETGNGLKPRSGNTLQGFVIAADDKQFVAAEAILMPDGKSVKVYSNKVINPKSVRYAWANYPIDANLVNSDNLPAAPFRTDNWFLETDNDR